MISMVAFMATATLDDDIDNDNKESVAASTVKKGLYSDDADDITILSMTAWSMKMATTM